MRGQFMWPSWTRQHPQQFPDDLRKDLIPLAIALDGANKLILHAARRHNLLSASKYPSGVGTLQSYDLSFEALDIELDYIEYETMKSIFVKDEYVRIWKATVRELLEFQGSDGATLQWRVAKQLAIDILEQRDLIVGLYLEVEQRLKDGGWQDICNSIMWKIRALERYSAVYNAQPSPRLQQPNPPPEKTYELWSLAELRNNVTNEGKVSSAYSTTQHEHFTTTITALVSLTILVAMIPLGFAYSFSSSETGSTSDVDFYLLIQSSIMGILGIAIAICPTFRWSMSQSRWWSQVFAIIGVFCAISTVPMYLKLPIMWSAFMSFVAMSVQVYMALQLAVALDCSMPLLKQD